MGTAPPRAEMGDFSGSPRGKDQGFLRVAPGNPRVSGSGARRWETGPMNEPTPAPTAPSPVVLDVWCELQCPDCRSALADLDALRARYGDRLEIRLRHFPLEKHKHAFAGAQAAEEAFAQGQGWPFVAAVLRRVEDFAAAGEPFLVETAGELGLDAEEFDTALIDGRHILTVDADQAEGKALGVKGTPTYEIGGTLLDGSKTQEGLRERIEEIADGLLAG